jgi:tartrate/fumarate subfamily iron-sulfur-dependent hydro-lyase beta chain
MINLTAPLTDEHIRNLKVGDIVSLSGTLITGRDSLSKYLYEGNASPIPLKGQALYHCGPIVLDNSGTWEVIAAGPTTSARQEPFAWKIIEQTGVKALIGKGGMGEKTVRACKECGCVYLHAIGGTAQLLAEKITKVKSVHFLKEFGSPEAMWEFEVKNFPAVVTIDTRGNSLHHDILSKSEKSLTALLP